MNVSKVRDTRMQRLVHLRITRDVPKSFSFGTIHL